MLGTLPQRLSAFAKKRKLSDLRDTVDIGGWTLAFILMAPLWVLVGAVYLVGLLVKVTGISVVVEASFDKLFPHEPEGGKPPKSTPSITLGPPR